MRQLREEKILDIKQAEKIEESIRLKGQGVKVSEQEKSTS